MNADVEMLLVACGWEFAEVEHWLELRHEQSLKVLATIERRPGYCDRGHWKVLVECVPYLDEQDAFPRYFMRLETAKQELVEFLAWRLFKRRVQE